MMAKICTVEIQNTFVQHTDDVSLLIRVRFLSTPYRSYHIMHNVKITAASPIMADTAEVMYLEGCLSTTKL